LETFLDADHDPRNWVVNADIVMATLAYDNVYVRSVMEKYCQRWIDRQQGKISEIKTDIDETKYEIKEIDRNDHKTRARLQSDLLNRIRKVTVEDKAYGT